MLRMLCWTALTITVVLGLLWGAHSFLPGVSGLGGLNDLMGIAAGVCAVITLVLFFVPLRDGGQDRPRSGATANRIEGGVQVGSYGGDHVDFSGATFNASVTGKRDTSPDSRDGGKQ